MTETAAVHLAKAREAEAEAQGTAAEKNAEKRLFEQRLKLADIDASIAARGRKMISGADGGKPENGLPRARATRSPRRRRAGWTARRRRRRARGAPFLSPPPPSRGARTRRVPTSIHFENGVSLRSTT